MKLEKNNWENKDNVQTAVQKNAFFKQKNNLLQGMSIYWFLESVQDSS